jgi:signal peptidase I
MPNLRPTIRIAVPALTVATLMTAAIALSRSRLRRYAIAELSMQPALGAGDWVLARRVVAPLERGDIVVFEHPGRADFELVKRVVGLPGEHVLLAAGEVTADGRTVDAWATGPTMPDGSWRLGPHEVFVLGDNRAFSSGDSRALGPIPVADIGWVIWCRYRPLPLRRVG